MSPQGNKASSIYILLDSRATQLSLIWQNVCFLCYFGPRWGFSVCLEGILNWIPSHLPHPYLCLK